MNSLRWWFSALQLGAPLVLAAALGDGALPVVAATCVWFAAVTGAYVLVEHVMWMRRTDELLSQKPTLSASLPELLPSPSTRPSPLRDNLRELNAEESFILAALDDGSIDEAQRRIREHFQEDREQLCRVIELDECVNAQLDDLEQLKPTDET